MSKRLRDYRRCKFHVIRLKMKTERRKEKRDKSASIRKSGIRPRGDVGAGGKKVGSRRQRGSRLRGSYEEVGEAPSNVLWYFPLDYNASIISVRAV